MPIGIKISIGLHSRKLLALVTRTTWLSYIYIFQTCSSLFWFFQLHCYTQLENVCYHIFYLSHFSSVDHNQVLYVLNKSLFECLTLRISNNKGVLKYYLFDYTRENYKSLLPYKIKPLHTFGSKLELTHYIEHVGSCRHVQFLAQEDHQDWDPWAMSKLKATPWRLLMQGSIAPSICPSKCFH